MDPPWSNRSVTRGGGGRYDTMSTNRILSLIPLLLPLLHPEQCVVGIWVTNSPTIITFVKSQFIPAMGFNYSCSWVWLKTTADGRRPISPPDSTHKKPLEILIIAQRNISVENKQVATREMVTVTTDSLVMDILSNCNCIQSDGKSASFTTDKTSNTNQDNNVNATVTVPVQIVSYPEKESVPIQTMQECLSSSTTGSSIHFHSTINDNNDVAADDATTTLPLLPHHDHCCSGSGSGAVVVVSPPLRHSWKPAMAPLLYKTFLPPRPLDRTDDDIKQDYYNNNSDDDDMLELFARELRPHCMSIGEEVLLYQLMDDDESDPGDSFLSSLQTIASDDRAYNCR
eukprot:gene11675-24453_t